MAPRVLCLLALAALPSGLASGEASQTGANPIRKVVTMLQSMQAKVTAEGKKEQDLYDKFMCYCKNSGGDLEAGITAATNKIGMVGTDIKSAEGAKAEAEADLKQAQEDRSAAKAAMAEATAIREKEAAAYAAEKAEYTANIAALGKAIKAVEKGVAGSFVQTLAAGTLRKLASSETQVLGDEDKQTLLAFLSGSQSSEYAPQSGEILGVLKQLEDELNKGLSDSTATETSAIASFGELMAAKTKEVAATSAAIESKLSKIAELGVSIAQMKNDLTDTEEALLADQDFLANLESSCKTKTAEWEEIKKTRSEELLALADTIKVLNDDDALELFKKTLPSASASFVQMKVNKANMRARALAEIMKVKADAPRMDIIMLALRGKKIGFEKVIKMIDDMVVTLKKEQDDDDHKKEYCEKQFDLTDDKKKGLERKISDQEAAIATAEETIAQLTEEIAALKASIKALDKDVAEATEQRKQENADYTDLMAANSAAIELMKFAKNRLNKFYNPKMYKAPPKRELSAADRIAVNNGGGTAPPTAAPGGIAGTGITVFAQIRQHVQLKRDAPPPPPETFGAYTKKSEESNGVMAMIDLLIKDLQKEMTEAETAEKDAQADYAGLMKDSAETRTKDSKLLTEKEAAKADTEAMLETHTEAKASSEKELQATMMYLQSLHNECDWLMKYFDMRKEARASEIDALGKAKAVLSGADFSLVQTKALRGAKW